jgi:hypothetical protein
VEYKTYKENELKVEVAVFDLREPNMLKRLQEENAGWKKAAHVETLDENHVVLVIHPGGALEVR